MWLIYVMRNNNLSRVTTFDDWFNNYISCVRHVRWSQQLYRTQWANMPFGSVSPVAALEK